MKTYQFDGKTYRLPNLLNEFQLKMYIHLIDWKWEHLTNEPGYSKNFPYDAILPDEYKDQQYPLFRPIKDLFLEQQKIFQFKSHPFLGHMASSQAACANLFLPILSDPEIAAKVLSSVKPDLKKIAVDYLHRGFRLEFWDDQENVLNDHSKVSGTDADIAIAYYDQDANLNLWLIEHKLTEAEFTQCGGFQSRGRTQSHACGPVSAILENPNLCYYHSQRNFRYWDISLSSQSPIDIEKIKNLSICPFSGGVNQLWRNQLLAAGIELSTSASLPYKKVYFSVVHHPQNSALKPSIEKFQEILRQKDRFFSFTTETLVAKAKELDHPTLSDWLNWYQNLYFFETT